MSTPNTIAVVVSDWNSEITDGLLQGALGILRGQLNDDQLTIIHVPGAFEIPVTCDTLAATGRYQAIVALGCVIKGETAHFEFIAEQAMRGIADVALKYHLPVSCGILTTYTDEQAEARSRNDENNKGAEAARAVLAMINVLNSIT
jgi:6,7-dimethyl-8-ribityllumazine synthase